jgi:hypothetical protein
LNIHGIAQARGIDALRQRLAGGNCLLSELICRRNALHYTCSPFSIPCDDLQLAAAIFNLKNAQHRFRYPMISYSAWRLLPPCASHQNLRIRCSHKYDYWIDRPLVKNDWAALQTPWKFFHIQILDIYQCVKKQAQVLELKFPATSSKMPLEKVILYAHPRLRQFASSLGGL